jgi:hypothetical protein
MTRSILAPDRLNDGLPACPDWCQVCQPADAVTVHGHTFGPSRLHAAILLDGAVKVSAERYDEGDSTDVVDIVLSIGAVHIDLTPVRRHNLRAALDEADRIAGAR